MQKLVAKGKFYGQTLSMRKSLPRASAVLLVFALVIILFNVSTLMSDVLDDKNVPQAIKGKIDLDSLPLSSVGSVPLTGNWAFYWQELLTPEDIADKVTQASYIGVPHAWVRANLGGAPLEKYGAATYQVKVKTDKQYSRLALKIPAIGTAYTVYIDDVEVATGGKVGYTKATSEPDYNSTTIIFEPKSELVTITVQVSNHDYHWGGIWSALRIGEPLTVQKEQYQQILRTTFLLAIFLTVALFNLIQFTLRTADPLPVIIALTCLSLGLREIESSQVLHIAGLVEWSFATNTKVNFLTFYVTAPLLVAYFHLTFWQDYKKSVLVPVYLVCTLVSAYVLLMPPKVFSETMPYFQTFTLVLMPYVFWGLIQAVRNQRHGARLLMIGSLFLFALVLNDILYNLQVIDTTLMVSFGLIAFVLCQNYLTYIRFIDAGQQNELLSQTLEDRNEELQHFSQSLEEKVEQRTDELAKANRQLGELANKDMLTGLPNRRGMMQFVEESMVQFRQNNTPFCLLLIDFDHFKQLNDSLGHEAGDRTLTEGAEIMRKVLRVQDQVARWGGEEFLILLPGTPTKGAKILAHKVKDNLKLNLSNSIGIAVTVTIGVASFEETDTLNSCLIRADKALYQGKSNGRNTVVMASSTAQNQTE